MICCVTSLLLIGLALLSGVESEFSEFALVFMENIVEEFPTPLDVEIYVASRTDTQTRVRVDNPTGNAFGDYDFMLASDAIRKLTLPASLRMSGTRTGYKVVRIRAADDVIVYGLNRNRFSSDGFTAYKVSQTGEEYYAAAYGPPNFSTEIGIAASFEGSTLVTITVPTNNPPDGTVVQWNGRQYQSGESFSVSLNRYQSLQLQALIGDLTGAKIVSSNPVSVFSGNVRVSIDGASRDHLVEQLPPTEQWGFDYYTVRTPGRTTDRPDIIRIVAKDDNTRVTYRSGAVNREFILQPGTFQEVQSFEATWIHSDQPVMVAVFVTSQSRANSGDIGDPSMIVIPAVGQYSADYTFSTPSYTKPLGASTDDYDITLMIVANTTDSASLELNGAPLNPQWTLVSGSTYSYSYTSLISGRSYQLRHPSNSNARFMALLYGSADRESFYFPIDVGMTNINVIVPVEIVGNRGEQGEKGARGQNGSKGFIGAKGQIGATGNSGARGVTGQKGEPGVDGSGSATGATGATGAAGGTGPIGSTGAQGSTGQQGLMGPIGATGARGPKGNQGVQGPPGVSGPPGPPGEPGYRGSSGDKGAEGDHGFKGSTGELGPPGFSGAKGSVSVNGCAGINRCPVIGSDDNAACKPTFGSVDHICNCPSGFHMVPSSWEQCIDINECVLGFCSHFCTNTNGSYICSCPSGYTLAMDGRNCQDVNECDSASACAASQTCMNGIGSFFCINVGNAQLQQVQLTGLQVLYKDEFFLGILCLLILLTLLLIILATSLLVRHRKRYSLHKQRRQEQLRTAYSVAAIPATGYY